MGEVTGKTWNNRRPPAIMAEDLNAIEAGIVAAQGAAADALAEAEGRAPAVHSHTIAQVDGLQTALDDAAGGAPAAHTHEIADVDGLQTALDGKASTAYQLVGTGRPDQPATTPYSSAQLTAAPSMAEYRSTDGAGVGARLWRKHGTVWRCVDLNTGWRNMLPTFQSIAAAAGSTVTTPPSTGAPAIIRRRLDVMDLHINLVLGEGLNGVDFKTALGHGALWNVAWAVNWQIPAGVTGSAGVVHWYAPTFVQFWDAGNLRLNLTVPLLGESNTIPTTLPGLQHSAPL